jgi:hypothetical protein
MSYHIEINEYQRRLIMKALTSTDVNQFSQAPGSGDAFDTEAKEFVCLVQMFGTLDLDEARRRARKHDAKACRRLHIPRRWGCPPQSPAPGFGEKYWSLSGFPSHSLESGGGAFLTVIFGQIFAYSAFSDSHFSSPDSASGLIASTGHSGSQTPQSMHSSGWMTSMFSPS